MTTILLIVAILSVAFNAFFIHYLFSNNLEVSFGDPERAELEILHIAVEKIHGIERKADENPEIAYKEAKRLAKVAIDEIILHRNRLK